LLVFLTVSIPFKSQEYYADYIAVDNNYDHQSFDRMIDGMLSVLLSMKKKPIIRYQKSSEVCKKLADNLTMRMERERGLFDFRSNPVLLLVDRRDDPITPLLTQWTY
jgi:vacuolar protein sorting-associated protein 45